jgi:hypothetical protein
MLWIAKVRQKAGAFARTHFCISRPAGREEMHGRSMKKNDLDRSGEMYVTYYGAMILPNANRSLETGLKEDS